MSGFHLLALPGEIREMIYYWFVVCHIARLRGCSRFPEGARTGHRGALLLVCRQVYTEFFFVVARSTRVVVSCGWSGCDRVTDVCVPRPVTAHSRWLDLEVKIGGNDLASRRGDVRRVVSLVGGFRRVMEVRVTLVDVQTRRVARGVTRSVLGGLLGGRRRPRKARVWFRPPVLCLQWAYDEGPEGWLDREEFPSFGGRVYPAYVVLTDDCRCSQG